ncbi:bcl-2-binding component 3 [Fundulus diaphanus]
MARAETIETLGESRGGGNGPLSCHNTCRMELPQHPPTWTSPLTARSGAPPLQNSSHNMEPLQALYLSNVLPRPQQEGRGEAQTHQQSPASSPSPTPPQCPVRAESSGRTLSAADSSEEQPDSNREEQGPLPDLLPQHEPHQRGPGGEAVQQLDVRRVGRQLRRIGDELDATVFHRADVPPQWHHWRDATWELLNFLAQMMSTFYRLR